MHETETTEMIRFKSNSRFGVGLGVGVGPGCGPAGHGRARVPPLRRTAPPLRSGRFLGCARNDDRAGRVGADRSAAMWKTSPSARRRLMPTTWRSERGTQRVSRRWGLRAHRQEV